MTPSGAPLVALVEAFGLSRTDVAAQERPELISGTFELVRDAALDVVSQLAAAVVAYGPALRVTLIDGESATAAGQPIKLLEVHGALDPSAVTEAIEALRLSPAPKLALHLDKDRLLPQLHDGVRTVLVLFHEALERLLTSLEGVAELLDADAPTLVVLPDDDLHEVGGILGVVGGAHADQPPVLFTAAAPEIRQALAEERAELVTWQQPWPGWLTPRHLLTVPGAQADAGRPAGAVAALLTRQVVVVALLSLADRVLVAEGAPGRILCEFRGAEQQVEVPVPLAHDLPVSAREPLVALVEWCYSGPAGAADASWATDRLPLVRDRVVRRLATVARERRAHEFAGAGGELLDEAKWRWQAIAERRSAALVGEVREAEQLVGASVQSVADQIGALTRSVTETVLAGVGTLLASVVAAAFAPEFDAGLFRFVVIAYAVYLLVFPGMLGSLGAWRRFERVSQTWDESSRRLLALLPLDRRDEMRLDRVDAVRCEFWWWLRGSVALYVLFSSALAYAAFHVDSLIA